jgi:hypothetical protein
VPGFRVVLDLSSASPIAAGCIDLIAGTSRQLIAEGHPVRVVVPDQLAAEAVQAAGVKDVVVDRRNENRLAADVVVPDDLAAQKLASGS